tara:strand:- start:30 stop:1241 length:1212 start_codon:yes stop_codon:yes gene_type:complete
MAKDSIEYNLDSFIAEQKQLGRGDDELKEFIGKRFGDKAVKLHFDKSEEKTTENPVTEFFKQIPSEVLIPGVGALAGGAGVAAGYAFKSLKDRMAESKGAPPRIDPLMDVNQRPPTGRIEPDFNTPAPSVVKISKDPIEQRLFEISQAQQAAKTQPPMMGQPGFQPSAPVAPPSVQSLDQSFAASVAPPVAPPVGAESPNPYMSVGTTPAAPSAPVAPTQPTPAATEPKKTGGRPTKQAVAAEMEGKVFKEGFGGADNYLEKQFGPDIRRFMKDEFNQGKPYGGGQAAMDKAYADIKKYDAWLKENIPVQTLNREERKAMGVPPPKDYPVLGKAMKVGGAAGLLMTAGQAANAREAIGNVAEALLPLGMTPSDLAPGTLTKKQLEAYKEAQKLGSPYRSVPPR